MSKISVPVAGDPYSPQNNMGPGASPGHTTGAGMPGTGVGTGVADVGTGAGTGVGGVGTGAGTGGAGVGTGAGTAPHATFDNTATHPAVAEAPRRSSRFALKRGERGSGTGTAVPGRRTSVPHIDMTRRGSAAVHRASVGDPTIFHAKASESGWRGLFANRRSLAVALFASLGGLLYGYNQGVFGQVQVMQEFYYRYKSTLDINNTPTKKGMLTAILELGAMVGAIMAGPIADRWSRKYSISGWCVLFIIGTIIQVAANRHVACIYAGRWFAGMAVGALSMLVPMWNAEVASPGIRGALVALQQLAITFGILVSYWIAYGTNYIGGTSYDPTTGKGQSTAAWRVPLALQLVPGVILCIGACFLPFSPRWLMLKGREQECLDVLCYLRNGPPDDPAINFEYKSLQAERLAEKVRAQEMYGQTDENWRTAITDYRRIFTTKSLLHRLMVGAGAQMLQQWTGINAVIYYAPTIFQQLGLTGNTSSLLATGVVGIVNFVFTFPAVLWVDVVGRRPGMIVGAANMAIAHATIGAIIAVFGDRFQTDEVPGRGAIFMVYYFIVWFAITWGPMAWIVSAEVWPLQYRSRGMGISSATNWVNNFAVALSTPVMIANIGWKTYMVFMTTCLVAVVWAIFLLPELKGLSLEQIDEIFHDSSATEDLERRKRVAAEVGLEDAEHQLGMGTEKGMVHDDPAYRRSDVEASAPLTATQHAPLDPRLSSTTAYTSENEKDHLTHEPMRHA